MIEQKAIGKGRVSGHEKGSVRKRYCADCGYAVIHETGSMIWVSCKFQDGWRSVSSQCNLPDSEFLKLKKRREKV